MTALWRGPVGCCKCRINRHGHRPADNSARAGSSHGTATRSRESANFGRREAPDLTVELLQSPAGQDLIESSFNEAADVVEAVRRLWDSWEDTAIIRDLGTGRFLDRNRLHHVNFRSEQFSIAGPSITPRPPQGQVLVTALAHAAVPYRLAARAADVVFITPTDAEDARRIVGTVRDIERQVDRSRPPLRIFADLVVVIDESATAAAASRVGRCIHRREFPPRRLSPLRGAVGPRR